MNYLTAKSTVSKRAVLARVNRRLAHDGERLKKWRHRNGWYAGSYYWLDVNRNFIRNDRVELESFARNLGVLGEGEQMVSEDC